MKCYKITGAHQRSLIAYGMSGIRYEVGVEATAPNWLSQLGYGPTAFESLVAAELFMSKLSVISKLWVAVGRGLIYPTPEYASSMYLSNGKLHIVRSDEIRTGWPKGTIMFEGLTLVERV